MSVGSQCVSVRTILSADRTSSGPSQQQAISKFQSYLVDRFAYACLPSQMPNNSGQKKIVPLFLYNIEACAEGSIGSRNQHSNFTFLFHYYALVVIHSHIHVLIYIKTCSWLSAQLEFCQTSRLYAIPYLNLNQQPSLCLKLCSCKGGYERKIISDISQIHS